MSPTVTFVTGNANKLREVKAILEPAIQVQSKSLDIDEIQGSINDITQSKCRKAAELINGPVLVEDTALCFNALGGLPGPYMLEFQSSSPLCLDSFVMLTPHLFTSAHSKHFLTTLGHDGLNKLLAAYPDKTIEAVCTFGYSAGPNQEPVLFQGRCPGNLVHARGPTRFGWDPIFEYQGQTFAEMDACQKNSISHRARALEMLKKWFLERSTSLDTLPQHGL